MKRRWLAVLLVCSGLLAHDPEYSNHLSGETSPYLLQHVHNPVDWYPWNDAAFEKAKREHKPIFLSIGFSTCHWCHVMAEESFEDPQIAAMLNRWFVSVKVDREAMPDIDRHFQTLYRHMHGRSGGWPLSVVMTETGKPFFTGTYIPPTDAYGIEGMLTLLPRIGREYAAERKLFEAKAQQLANDQNSRRAVSDTMPEADAVKTAYQALEGLEGIFDDRNKGFGTQPKFPQSSRIMALLDIYKLTKALPAKAMVMETLETMAKSGLYDQIEGAFFRYSTNRDWTQPHFEKMLYTNAQLVSAYAAGWNASRNPLFERVIRETIAEMGHRFQTREGLWFAASSADSEHGEGGYFLYTYDEADSALEKAGFSLNARQELLHYFSIEEDGNFDGEVSHIHLSALPAPNGVERARSVLKELREKRRFPFRDKKIITAWNAMMVSALFDASVMDMRYVKMAKRSYAALHSMMSDGKSALFHQTLYGHIPSQPGLLEDYAYMVQAAIKGYETTLEQHYLDDAVQWTKTATALFYGDGAWRLGKGAYSAFDDGSDKYYTSPMGVMLANLLSLEILTSDIVYEKPVNETIKRHADMLFENPAAHSSLMMAYLRYKLGIVGIKHRPGVLHKYRSEIEAIDYPFIIIEAEPQSDRWIACSARSCFGTSKTFDGIKKRVEARKAVTTAPSLYGRHR